MVKWWTKIHTRRHIGKREDPGDEVAHTTDLSVSGEEGHSTILLTHYSFWF